MSDNTTNATEIRNIVGGGSGNHGEHTFFVFEYPDRTRQTFACATILMAKMVNNLRTYARMADEDRVKVKGGQLGPAAPYYVTTLANSAHSDDGEIVMVQWATTDGVPIDLAMRPQQALETIAALQRELDHVGYTSDKTDLN